MMEQNNTKAQAFELIAADTSTERMKVLDIIRAEPEAVHWRNEAGNTLFMEGVLSGVNWLLQAECVNAGGNVNAVNEKGETALHLAFQLISKPKELGDRAKELTNVGVLLETFGVNPFIQDKQGRNARDCFNEACTKLENTEMLRPALDEAERLAKERDFEVLTGGLGVSLTVKSGKLALRRPESKHV